MKDRTPTFRSAFVPPLAAGLAFAAAKSIARGPAWGGFYWQSPFMFSFLAGLLIAIAARPLLERLTWHRGTAFAIVLGWLLAMGPAAQLAESQLHAAFGWMGYSYALPSDPRPDLLAAWVLAGLLAWLYRSESGEIGFANLLARARKLGGKRLPLRVAALGAVFSLAGLALGLLDAQLLSGESRLPLYPSNPWLRAALSSAEAGGDGAPLGVFEFAGIALVSWVKGVAVALTLLPITWVLRGGRAQMTLLFTILPFVIGEFAPLMENQPFPSQSWLGMRVLLSAIAAAFAGHAAAWLIAQPPPERPGALN